MTYKSKALFIGNTALIIVVWFIMPVDVLINGKAKWYRKCLKNFDYIQHGYWSEDHE